MSQASIILPVWNGEECILNCIDSIKNQTFNNFECIIVDDGSTDNTIAIVEQSIADDSRFKLIRTSHEGLSNARNVGIENASSETIFYVDADDQAKPEMVEKVLKFMDENNLEIAIFDADVVNGDAMPSLGIQKYFCRKSNYGIKSGKEILSKMVGNGDYVYAVFIQAIRKSAIRKKFCYGLRAQDILYTTQNLFLAERVGHLSEKLYIKRAMKKSVSSSPHDAHYAWSLFKTLMELKKFVDEGGYSNFALEQIMSYSFIALIYALKCLNRSDWKEFEQMTFSERVILKNLAWLVHNPVVSKSLDIKIPENLNAY